MEDSVVAHLMEVSYEYGHGVICRRFVSEAKARSPKVEMVDGDRLFIPTQHPSTPCLPTHGPY